MIEGELLIKVHFSLRVYLALSAYWHLAIIIVFTCNVQRLVKKTKKYTYCSTSFTTLHLRVFQQFNM